MTYREVFTRFLADLSKFNQNELIIVTYDPTKNLLIYRQMNNLVMASYLCKFFLPKKRFRIGVLTQSGYNKLIYSLNELLKSTKIDNTELIPDLRPLGLDWYQYFNDVSIGYPQRVISLKFVTITNKFYTWLLCKHYNDNSKIIYNLAKNKINGKSNYSLRQSRRIFW